MLPQWLTETILRRRFEALGGTVTFSTELEDLDEQGDQIAATLSGGKTLTTRFVVGADGGRSTVRKLAGIALEGNSPELPGMGGESGTGPLLQLGKQKSRLT